MIGDFHFLRPYWLLTLIPFAMLLWQFQRQTFSSRNWQSVCDAALLPHILIDAQQQQRQWPLLALALTGVLAIIALAGPAWQQLEQPVFRDQSALVIVLDLSRSMDAGDIKPSRLTRARYKVTDILRRRQEGQTALIAYAADAYAVSPLTQDADTIITLAKTLSTELMPAQGSRPDKALQKAVKLLQQSGATAGEILLITDGIEKSMVSTLATLVKDHGHQLSVLAVGTAQGAPISIAGGGYLKDRSGSIVLPKLEPQVLRQLAQQGGGRYHQLSADDRDLNYLLTTDQSLSLEDQAEDTSMVTDQWREEGPWLLLLILPFAALAFRRGTLVLVIIICLPILPRPALAFEWNELWSRPDQQAANAMQQSNDSTPAAELFTDPAWQAAAHYRAGQYEQAVSALQNATTADELYNKANALAQAGQLKEAITAYDQALQQNPAHEDAKYNRDLVQKQLDQQPSSNDENEPSDDQQDKQRGDDEPQESDNGQGGDKQNNKNNNAPQDSNDSSPASDEKQDNGEPDDVNSAQQDTEETQNEKKEQAAQQDSEQATSEEQTAATADDLKQTEAMQANEQWLRRIPDDPGGLLRRKFLYEYQRKQQSNQIVNESSPW